MAKWMWFKIKFALEKVENTMGKGENAGYLILWNRQKENGFDPLLNSGERSRTILAHLISNW